ncbi:MAG: hypothetical protein INR71_12550 [Terriglobus roseus]|nr:hypothetical protein [Terriglobus roseus]
MAQSTHVPAFVRICGPPNSNFLVGYPGISATLVRCLLQAGTEQKLK